MQSIPTIHIVAQTLGEAWHNACLLVDERGLAVETPKHIPGMSLGKDANVLICVTSPLDEPRLHKLGITDDDDGLINYTLEVVFGIHDHWVDLSDPHKWQYTYHERLWKHGQYPRMLVKIAEDYANKKRATGRDYQITTWDPTADLECVDPPCLQTIQFRLIDTNNSGLSLQMNTHWRSRDLFKAWLMNVFALTELQRYTAKRLSKILKRKVTVGSYIDHSDSLHLYGLYYDRDGLSTMLGRMRTEGYSKLAMPTKEFIAEDISSYLRKIYAQSVHERSTGAKKAPVADLDMNLAYPEDWDLLFR